EFGRLHGGQADINKQLAAITRILRVILQVALDEEGLLWRGSEEHTVSPCAREKCSHIAFDPRPQVIVIWFENHPLRTNFNGFFNVIEQSSHIDIAPVSFAAQRAGAPDAYAATGEGANAVDPTRIERV